MNELKELGKTEITVVPVFLYNGIHIKEDLPVILAEVKATPPQLKIKLTAVLGIDHAGRKLFGSELMQLPMPRLT
ncbi:MAG: hypothetical protein GX357_05390 [Firmicutes bacterium]|nr:hypothetical protein [Bacillota bacterium]